MRIAPLGPLTALLLSACAGTTPAPQLSARDPADPRAQESAAVPLESGLDPPAVLTKPASDTYVCPMHPQVTQTEPGACHVCGMALVKHATHEHQP